MVEDDVVRRIHRLADFLQHDIPLARQLRLVEQAVLDDVAEDVDGERQVALQRLAEERRRLARRPGVDMAADRLDLVGDVLRAAARRALEHHVFEQVGDAVDLGRFVARAGVDPDAAGHRLDGACSSRPGRCAVDLGRLVIHSARSLGGFFIVVDEAKASSERSMHLISATSFFEEADVQVARLSIHHAAGPPLRPWRHGQASLVGRGSAISLPAIWRRSASTQSRMTCALRRHPYHPLKSAKQMGWTAFWVRPARCATRTRKPELRGPSASSKSDDPLQPGGILRHGDAPLDRYNAPAEYVVRISSEVRRQATHRAASTETARRRTQSTGVRACYAGAESARRITIRHGGRRRKEGVVIGPPGRMGRNARKADRPEVAP